jgi:hypothetical protein
MPLPLLEQLPLLPTEVTTQPLGSTGLENAQMVSGPVPCGTRIV